MASVFLNGEICEGAEARVSVEDRGFLLGDGIFETMRAYRGHVFRLATHFARLRASAEFFRIPVPCSDDEIKAGISELMQRNACPEAYVRLTLTRGTGGRGLLMSGDWSPTVLIQAREFAPYPDEQYRRGARMIVSTVRQSSGSPVVRHKTLNYLPYLLARQEAADAGAQGAILLNERGQVAEESVSNVFLVFGETLATPPAHAGILPGVTRGVVMELAEADGIAVEERPLAGDALFGADEIVLTNSLREVLPVRSVDKRAVGEGKPGPLTTRIQALYRKAVEAEVGGDA